MTDYSGNLVIDFIDYSLSDPPKYGVEECKERDVNYAAPFKVLVRLNNKVGCTYHLQCGKFFRSTDMERLYI